IPERPREERIKRIRHDRSPSTDSTINNEHGYIRARLSQSIQGFSKTTGQISQLASIVKNLAETTSSPSNLVQPGTSRPQTIARAGNYQNPEEPFEYLKNCENSRKIENPHDRKGGNKRKYYNKREYTSKRTEYQHKSGVECYHCGEKGLFKSSCTKPSPWCRNCKNSGHETNKCPKQFKNSKSTLLIIPYILDINTNSLNLNSLDSVNELGQAKSTEMTISFSDNTPITYRPYRLSLSERKKHTTPCSTTGRCPVELLMRDYTGSVKWSPAEVIKVNGPLSYKRKKARYKKDILIKFDIKF
ncbi:hypothetical protein CBL_20884, partial [Carabus blaptoides fortunei]